MVCSNCGEEKANHKVMAGVYFCILKNKKISKGEMLKALGNEAYLIEKYTYKEAV